MAKTLIARWRWLLLIATVWGIALPAWGHARLEKANPADKSSLDIPPVEIELQFNELLDAGFNSVEVYSAEERTKRDKRTNYVLGKPLVDPKDRTRLVTKLKPLPPGRYIVEYRVLSRDGHTAPGRITFEVREHK